MIAMPNTSTCLICGGGADVIHCHKTGPGELSATDTEHRTLLYGLCLRGYCFQDFPSEKVMEE